MKFVKDLNDLLKSDVVIVGGKRASLGETIQASIPVLPGFVIFTTALEKFLEETNLNVEISSILCIVNHKKIYTIVKRFR